MNNVRIPMDALKKWNVPTSMFYGDQTLGALRDASKSVCAAMANCKLVTLEGQGHLAAQLAPAMFVSKVLEAAGQ